MRKAKREYRKKVKSKEHVNAIECDFNGIHFKSKLELYCYKQLLLTGWKFTYEEEELITFPKFKCPIPCYKGKTTIKLESPNIREVSYNPDFIITINDNKYILETKGLANQQWDIRIKMIKSCNDFKKYKAMFIAKNQSQVKECIELIKQLEYGIK